MLPELLKLDDGVEHVRQLLAPSLEQTEPAEDLVLVEVKLPELGNLRGELLFGRLVLGVVLVVQRDYQTQVTEELSLVVGPRVRPGVHEVRLAAREHLVGDLGEQPGHALGCVVVPGDGVHHLDVGEERGDAFQDFLRSARVHGLERLLQRGQVLDVVLGFVGRVGEPEVDLLPRLVRV